MRTHFMIAAIGAALLGVVVSRAEDTASDVAIREAIKSLQAKKAQAADKADKDKIDLAISALEKVIGKSAAAPVPGKSPAAPAKGGESGPQITPEILKEKFGGRAVWDPKTGELTIAYDFRNQDQMKDFDLGGSKTKLANGTLRLLGKQKFTHVVPFNSMTVTADVTVLKPLGFYLGTTKDLQLYIHENWEVSMWLDGQAASKKMLPPGQHARALRYAMTVEEKRFALRVGSVVLGAEVGDKPRNGQVVLMGGHDDGAQFRNLVIKGEPDPDWIKTFFAP